MKLYAYDTELFPFAEIVGSMFGGVRDLTLLHNHSDAKGLDLVVRETDSVTPLHPHYYDNFNLMEELWNSFAREHLLPLFEGDVLVQRIPTFRVQLPNNKAVGEFHKDSKYGHTNGALNIFLPLTDTNAYNTIWVETAPGLGDYAPVVLKYGEFALWDGVNHMHGNFKNSSQITRVSIDARLLSTSGLPEKWDKSAKSINMKIPLAEGGYYQRMKQ